MTGALKKAVIPLVLDMLLILPAVAGRGPAPAGRPGPLEQFGTRSTRRGQAAAGDGRQDEEHIQDERDDRVPWSAGNGTRQKTITPGNRCQRSEIFTVNPGSACRRRPQCSMAARTTPGPGLELAMGVDAEIAGFPGGFDRLQSEHDFQSNPHVSLTPPSTRSSCRVRFESPGGSGWNPRTGRASLRPLDPLRELGRPMMKPLMTPSPCPGRAW